MQIYGIDLAKEKFDVSFFDLTSKKVSNHPSHKVVKNNFKSIGRFLETLPSDAVLVAEHTGVYGDTLLKCCMDSNVKIAFVGGYVIHRYRATADRAKTDVLDCALFSAGNGTGRGAAAFLRCPQKRCHAGGKRHPRAGAGRAAGAGGNGV